MDAIAHSQTARIPAAPAGRETATTDAAPSSGVTTETWLTPKRLARGAGLLYLVLILCGVFAEFFVREELIVWGDAAATAERITANESLFRLGLVADLIAHTTYFLLAFALYVLLRPVSRVASLLFLLLVTISAAVLTLNMVNQFAAWHLLSGPAYLSAFAPAQLESAAMFFLELHHEGYLFGQITYGSWLIPLGFVIYRSGYFPRILGLLLMVAGSAYTADFLANVLAAEGSYPEFASVVLLLPAVVAEFSLCAWLLVKGVRSHPTAPDMR